MLAMAMRARSGRPWELIAWARKRPVAERSIAQTKAQEKLLGRRVQVRIFTERQWEAIIRELHPGPVPDPCVCVYPRKPKEKVRKKKERKPPMPDQQDDFPANVQGHNLGDDVADHLVVSTSLFRMKPGAKAFPSIQLMEEDGLDVRAASNGRFIYFYAKGKLFAVSLEQIIKSARFHLSGKTEKPDPKPKQIGRAHV